MDLDKAGSFLAERNKGILVTLRANGRPQSSNIVFSYRDGVVRVSVTNDRAKTNNLRRDPRASLHVNSEDFWQYVVAEANAELSPLAATPGDDTCMELRRLLVDVQGEEHPDWDEFDQAMIADQRLVLRLPIERAYGQLG